MQRVRNIRWLAYVKPETTFIVVLDEAFPEITIDLVRSSFLGNIGHSSLHDVADACRGCF